MRAGIAIDDLRFSYPGWPGAPERELFADLRLHLRAGELAVLIGEADAGKTTLARILGSLVPRFTGGRMAGSVRAAGIDVAAARPFDLVERVGLAFQNPDEQIVTTRCDAEVAFALESLGLSRSAMVPRVREALRLAGLEAFAARNPATLSGGEKKRLLIACLAAIDPEVWVLDETFEELDTEWRSAVLRHLADRGRTALVLDSRWSETYDALPGRCALLCGGRALDPGPEPSRALADAGLALPNGRDLRQNRRSAAAKGAAGPTILRAEGIRYRYAEQGFELSVDSLELRCAEVCALLGANGSGKSTLARILCGLATPAAGSVLLDRGDGLRPARSGELTRNVGYLLQNPDYQVFLPTVREELEVGLAAIGVRGVAAADRVAEAVERFGLPGAEAPPALMSYGCRKLLQAATFWLLDRRIIILDESDSGLSVRQFTRLLEALRSGGAGILLITHDRELARRVAIRSVVLEAGRISAEGMP